MKLVYAKDEFRPGKIGCFLCNDDGSEYSLDRRIFVGSGDTKAEAKADLQASINTELVFNQNKLTQALNFVTRQP